MKRVDGRGHVATLLDAVPQAAVASVPKRVQRTTGGDDRVVRFSRTDVVVLDASGTRQFFRKPATNEQNKNDQKMWKGKSD